MTRYCPNGHPLEEWMTECPFCAKAGDGVRQLLKSESPSVNDDSAAPTPAGDLKATVVDGYTEFYRQPLKETVMDHAELKQTVVMGHDGDKAARRMGQLPLQGWLVVMNGPDKWRDFRLDQDRISLGTGAECDVRLKDEAVSTRHASIRRLPEGLVLTDLDSTNGTFVNNDPDRISKVILDDEDLIRCGNTYLKFRRL